MSVTAVVLTPLGPFHITVQGGMLVSAGWGMAGGGGDDPALSEALAQVEAFFAGRLTRFDLPLAPATGFAGAMRKSMCAIPFGRTRTYGDLAQALGVSAQAVGQGCGANPLPLIVPCHRVTGAAGLGGYSGGRGPETKAALLRFEGALLL